MFKNLVHFLREHSRYKDMTNKIIAIIVMLLL